MREVRLTARGHPAVTGRHDKTLELTAEDAITARATCILGVAAGPLPGDLPALRGPVRLTITAGGRSAALTGEANPAYASGDRLVVRRSGRADPDTFLVHASAAAADLPADLLAALREPGAAVEVTAAEIGTPPPVLLVLTPGEAPAAVARLAAQADLVVDLTGRGAPPPAVPLAGPRRHGVPRGLAGTRTVVVLAADLGEPVAGTVAAAPGARVAVWPPAPGADLLLAAGLPATPVLHAGPLPRTPAGRAELAARVAAAAVPAVLDIPPADLPAADLPPADLPPGGLPAGGLPGADPAPERPPADPRPAGEPGRADRASAGPGRGAVPPATPLLDLAEQSGPCSASVSRGAVGRGGGAGGARRPAGAGSGPAEPGWLAGLRAALPAHRLVVPDAALGWGVGARTVDPGEPAGDLRGLRTTPRVVLVPPDGPRPVPVDPAELARLLRRAGRTGRDAAAVLTSLGVPRKDAYRLATDPS